MAYRLDHMSAISSVIPIVEHGMNMRNRLAITPNDVAKDRTQVEDAIDAFAVVAISRSIEKTHFDSVEHTDAGSDGCGS